MEELEKNILDFSRSHGVFSWIELMAEDVESAKAFYASVLGWEFEGKPMDGGGVYYVATANGKPVAGLYAKPPEVPKDVPSHWASYVTVDDVDAASAKAVEMGSEIVFGIMHVPGVGRFCGVKDPLGAYFIMITYEGE